MAEEIKKRVVRIILNLALLFVLAIVMNVTIPSALAIITLIPNEGLTLSSAFILFFVIIMAFQSLRIILDLIRLIDLASAFLTKYIPGLKAERKISLIKALKELIIVIIIILLTTTFLPISFMLPSDVEPQLTLGLTIISLIVSIILIYDAGKTFYSIFQSGLDFFIEMIIGTQRKPKKES